MACARLISVREPSGNKPGTQLDRKDSTLKRTTEPTETINQSLPQHAKLAEPGLNIITNRTLDNIERATRRRTGCIHNLAGTTSATTPDLPHLLARHGGGTVQRHHLGADRQSQAQLTVHALGSLARHPCRFLCRNNRQLDRAAAARRVIHALGRFFVIRGLRQEDVRHKGLRIAVVQREPARLDLHGDAVAGQEHVVGVRQREAVAFDLA